MADKTKAEDPRIIPARPDLAALHLRGHVEADAYASGQPMRIAVPAAPLTDSRDAYAPLTSQVLFGENFTAYEVEAGWAWGQCALDGYVGYVPEADLMPEPDTIPTHRVSAMQALIYPEADIKTRPMGAVPLGSRMTVRDVDAGFAALDPGGFTPIRALKPLDEPEPLWVATAERFVGIPYLWGGRSTAGVDCSGLVQIALQSAGMSCPRDSDQQQAALGRDVTNAVRKRGDIVFWKGHVGIMTSPTKILHANAHHMETAIESYEGAVSRIGKNEFGEILAIKRITV
ncbi:MAG: NlpC/P60 family protein [Pseudomonadota bacterium]